MRSRPTCVAVIGAGACAIPAVLHHTHVQTEVHAVDIDDGMLQLARSHMGIKEDERLKLYSEDGFQFMQNAESQSYDVVIVDVAAPDLESQTAGHPGQLLAPIPAFLSQSFFSKDLVGQKLKLDGLLAVNVVGSKAHRDRVCAALSGFTNVHTYNLPDQVILLATNLPGDHLIEMLERIMTFEMDI